jgi:hypothetical protein
METASVADRQAIAKCQVPRHNHGSAGAAQHHETTPIERNDTARERRRPIVLVPTIYSIHSETYSEAFDITTVLGPASLVL